MKIFSTLDFLLKRFYFGLFSNFNFVDGHCLTFYSDAMEKRPALLLLLIFLKKIRVCFYYINNYRYLMCNEFIKLYRHARNIVAMFIQPVEPQQDI